ncbi:CD109 antigen-like [Scaptodrosophila lebanonensis]|uniref:CD109 antigen-like n=1 Tax=Drosophila lebanonensis TaxID=7225 RepID=A0A6J2TMI0_DROLE|nr:CD109 antigen-like [Scaptodrosophila lebanonensis]
MRHNARRITGKAIFYAQNGFSSVLVLVMNGTRRLAELGVWIFSIFLPVISVNGYYVIASAGSIYSGRSYGIALGILNSNKSSKCEVRISGPSYNASAEVELTPQEPVQYIQFNVPELKRGLYELQVRSLIGAPFYNKTMLFWNNFKNLQKIQTSKTHYRPGERLQFRVLWYDELLVPVQPETTAVVWIEDAQGNRIKFYKQMRTIKGVFEAQLQLGQRPVLGRWRICVQNGPDTVEECAYFELSEYQAPPFRVLLSSQRKLSLADKQLLVHVQARYSYDGPVEGNATLFLESYTDENVEHSAQRMTKTAFLHRGQAQFSIPLTSLGASIPKGMQLQLGITVQVEERFTGVGQNGSITVTLYGDPYTISCIRSNGFCRNLKLNIERTIGFRIKHVNGTAVQDKNGIVKLLYTPANPKDPTPPHVYESRLNSKGAVYFKVNLTRPQNAEALDTDQTVQYYTLLEYNGHKQDLLTTNGQLRTAESPGEIPESDESVSDYDDGVTKEREYVDSIESGVVQLRDDFADMDMKSNGKARQQKSKTSNNVVYFEKGIPTGAPQLFNFKLMQAFDYAICVILVNGNVIAATRVFPDHSKLNYNIKVQFTLSMWPFVRIYIYGMQATKTYLSVAQRTIVVKRPENTIQIQAPAAVSPGEDITLNIKTIRHSYVGLLAVEQNTLRLAMGATNDLNVDYMEFLKYQIRAYAPNTQHLEPQPGEDNGLVTLTNANFVLNADTVDTIPKGNRRNSPLYPRTASVGPKVRSQFADVWIFSSIEDTKDAWTKWGTRVPDSITNWQLSAFAMHPIAGLSLLSPPIEIISSKPFFMTTNMPDSIKRGEILKLPLVCFNKRNISINVIISLRRAPASFDLLTEKGNLLPNASSTLQQELLIPADDSSVVFFYLRAHSTGILKLNFTAKSTSTLAKDQDILYRTLSVKDGGFLIAKRVATIRSLNTPLTVEGKLELEARPQHRIHSVECHISRNIFSPKLRELSHTTSPDNAEQLITRLLGNQHLWEFLPSSQRTDKLREQLSVDFQSFLALRHKDGGFCYYAHLLELPTASCSSTWLTAYALEALYLLQAPPLEVEQRQLKISVRFLQTRRRGFYYAEQGPTPTRSHLTQLELTMEVVQILQKLQPTKLNRTVHHLWHQLNATTDSHLLIKGIKFVKRRHTDLLSWIPSLFNSSSNTHRQLLETAGRFLLCLLSENLESSSESSTLFQWLVSQLYGRDSVAESYESSFALHAIFAYVARIGYNFTENLKVQLYAQQKEVLLSFNAGNAWMVQRATLPFETREVHYRAHGLGQLLLQCSYNYDLLEPYERRSQRTFIKRYELKVRIQGLLGTLTLSLDMCIHLLPYVDNTEGSALDLLLPTGYALTDGNLKELLNDKAVRYAKSKEGKTRLHVELLPLSNSNAKCLTVGLRKEHELPSLRNGTLIAYDINDDSGQEPELVSFKI